MSAEEYKATKLQLAYRLLDCAERMARVYAMLTGTEYTAVYAMDSGPGFE